MTARWCGIWNRSACAASMPATSAPARMRLRSTITARSMHHHQSALHTPRSNARADPALPAHRANLAVVGRDWSATRQAAPFMPHCSDIVTIGRVKWIEGSKHTGKDNTLGTGSIRGIRAALSSTGATRAW